MHKTSIWFTPFEVEEINQRAEGTLSSHLGICFTEAGSDFLRATMPVDARTIQPMGILNGGASCALAETVGSAAANYCINQKTHICVGLDINMNHIRPARTIDKWVQATAKPLHLGKTTQVWEIKILDPHEKLVAVSRLTMAVLDRK